MLLGRAKKILPWALVLAESSHVFCCVLPTLLSVLTILSGLGFVGMIPAAVTEFHDAMHHYELHIIAGSGLITAFAWAVHFWAARVDCHNTGCAHEPCAPRKARAGKILVFGTLLFFANVTIYTFLHYLPEKGAYDLQAIFHSAPQAHDHEGHDHSAHDNHSH